MTFTTLSAELDPFMVLMVLLISLMVIGGFYFYLRYLAVLDTDNKVPETSEEDFDLENDEDDEWDNEEEEDFLLDEIV